MTPGVQNFTVTISCYSAIHWDLKSTINNLPLGRVGGAYGMGVDSGAGVRMGSSDLDSVWINIPITGVKVFLQVLVTVLKDQSQLAVAVQHIM